MKNIVKQINEKTGITGKELENMTYAAAYILALIADDKEAKEHFKLAYEKTL